MWLAASSRLLSDYFAIRNGCVSTQRLYHCVSAWPCGQALFLTFRSLTARVARRAATCQLHFSLGLRPSMLSVLRPAHRPRCAARRRASSIAITMLSLWLAAFRLLSSYLAIRNGCVSTATVPIAFKLGLAAKRSLYSLDRSPPALRGVQRSSNCIQPGLTAKHMLSILWPAHHPRCAARQHASTI